MAITYETRIRTIDGDLMDLEEVPQTSLLGQRYRTTLAWEDEASRVGKIYRKYQQKESELQAKVETADIENTTPEEFALLSAELQLTARAVYKLKPEVERLNQRRHEAGQSLFRLQGEHSSEVNKYLENGKWMSDSERNRLRRQILSRYSIPESV